MRNIQQRVRVTTDLEDGPFRWGTAVKEDYGLVLVVYDDEEIPEWVEYCGPFAPFVLASIEGIAKTPLADVLWSPLTRRWLDSHIKETQ